MDRRGLYRWRVTKALDDAMERRVLGQGPYVDVALRIWEGPPISQGGTWPVPVHLKRSIGAMLDDPGQRPLGRARHREILNADVAEIDAIPARHRCLTVLPTG